MAKIDNYIKPEEVQQCLQFFQEHNPMHQAMVDRVCRLMGRQPKKDRDEDEDFQKLMKAVTVELLEAMLELSKGERPDG